MAREVNTLDFETKFNLMELLLEEKDADRDWSEWAEFCTKTLKRKITIANIRTLVKSSPRLDGFKPRGSSGAHGFARLLNEVKELRERVETLEKLLN